MSTRKRRHTRHQSLLVRYACALSVIPRPTPWPPKRVSHNRNLHESINCDPKSSGAIASSFLLSRNCCPTQATRTSLPVTSTVSGAMGRPLGQGRCEQVRKMAVDTKNANRKTLRSSRQKCRGAQTHARGVRDGETPERTCLFGRNVGPTLKPRVPTARQFAVLATTQENRCCDTRTFHAEHVASVPFVPLKSKNVISFAVSALSSMTTMQDGSTSKVSASPFKLTRSWVTMPSAARNCHREAVVGFTRISLATSFLLLIDANAVANTASH